MAPDIVDVAVLDGRKKMRIRKLLSKEIIMDDLSYYGSDPVMRKDTARHYKEIRKLLHGNPSLDPPPQDQDRLFSIGIVGLVLIVLALILVASCSHPGAAIADEITDKDAVHAIIGEAENQGYRGMLLVACAIRNRGTLHGVYGLHAPRVKRHLYSNKIYLQASMAWIESKNANVCAQVHGAIGWEDTKAFGEPYWAKSMRLVLIYKDHKFYAKSLF